VNRAGEGAAAHGGRVIVVVGAGAANVKSTVALNLAVALAGIGNAPVTLVDLDGAPAAALGVTPPGAVEIPWLPRPLPVVATLDAVGDSLLPGSTVVVDPPPRLDATTRAVLDRARVVLVPVDASPLAARVLGEVAAAVGGGARLRVALARRLPRDVDRWGLVDRVDELAPGALLRSTLPMARPGAATRAGTVAHAGRRAAVLYAPGSAAARAYSALAAELMRDLGELDM
jgi:cellulose biosynthesis protein BcsQ